VLQIFIVLKNPSPWPGSNPQPLGPVASTLTTTPPRLLIFCYGWGGDVSVDLRRIHCPCGMWNHVNGRTRKETCPSANFAHHLWTALGTNPGLIGDSERPQHDTLRCKHFFVSVLNGEPLCLPRRASLEFANQASVCPHSCVAGC
jgi:hypothetical protein